MFYKHHSSLSIDLIDIYSIKSLKNDFQSMLFSLQNSNCYYISSVMRKPTFCICENKDADQLHGNREADQRLCFRYIDSTIPLLFKYEISSL